MAAIPHASLRCLEELHVNAKTGRAIRELLELVTGQTGPQPTATFQVRYPPANARSSPRLATNCTNEAIAADLILSTRTIERHAQNIYNKLSFRKACDFSTTPSPFKTPRSRRRLR